MDREHGSDVEEVPHLRRNIFPAHPLRLRWLFVESLTLLHWPRTSCIVVMSNSVMISARAALASRS